MTHRSFVVFIFTALTVFAASAQDRVEANIPFEFRVGQSLLPAGKYTVGTLGPSGTVMIRSVDARAAAIVITNAAQTNQRPTTGKLVFRKYGETHFLSQVWRPGYDQGRELVPTKAEREMAEAAQRTSGIQVASVPLNKR
jgi:hypothetical protein